MQPNWKPSCHLGGPNSYRSWDDRWPPVSQATDHETISSRNGPDRLLRPLGTPKNTENQHAVCFDLWSIPASPGGLDRLILVPSTAAWFLTRTVNRRVHLSLTERASFPWLEALRWPAFRRLRTDRISTLRERPCPNRELPASQPDTDRILWSCWPPPRNATVQVRASVIPGFSPGPHARKAR